MKKLLMNRILWNKLDTELDIEGDKIRIRLV